jgi:hypothetical protein
MPTLEPGQRRAPVAAHRLAEMAHREHDRLRLGLLDHVQEMQVCELGLSGAVVALVAVGALAEPGRAPCSSHSIIVRRDTPTDSAACTRGTPARRRWQTASAVAPVSLVGWPRASLTCSKTQGCGNVRP